MNERIKELKEQAMRFAQEKCEGKSRDMYGALRADIMMEKFARLIVQECLEACSRANEIRHFVPPTQEQVVLSCMREIEETFRR